MVAKYLSFIVFIIFVRTIVPTPIVDLQSVQRNFSKAILQAINYVNKTTDDGWDDCDANCQFQRKLRQALLESSKQEDGTFTESKSYFWENRSHGWEEAQCEENEIYLYVVVFITRRFLGNYKLYETFILNLITNGNSIILLLLSNYRKRWGQFPFRNEAISLKI